MILRFITLCLFVNLSLCVAVQTSLAQESFAAGTSNDSDAESAQESYRPAPFKLKGLTKKEILSKFGKPDRSQKKIPGRETWLFGQSMIFFSKEKVMAWTDSGELAQRNNLSAVRPLNPKGLARYSNSWENAWTPKSRQESREEVLKSMIGSGEF